MKTACISGNKAVVEFTFCEFIFMKKNNYLREKKYFIFMKKKNYFHENKL